jgi:hypothetical protein
LEKQMELELFIPHKHRYLLNLLGKRNVYDK